jgi:hypothetical protein
MQVMSPGGKVVRASHTGPYEESGAAHEAINRYIMVLKMEFAGAPWEVYITDPSEEPDPQKWETIIYYPVTIKLQDNDRHIRPVQHPEKPHRHARLTAAGCAVGRKPCSG